MQLKQMRTKKERMPAEVQLGAGNFMPFLAAILSYEGDFQKIG
jgi:hypothetical protein